MKAVEGGEGRNKREKMRRLYVHNGRNFVDVCLHDGDLDKSFTMFVQKHDVHDNTSTVFLHGAMLY